MNGPTAACVAFIWLVIFPVGLFAVDGLVERIVWGKTTPAQRRRRGKVILMEEVVARDAQYVDRLEEYNFPPTMGHAMRDRRYLLSKVRALEAALLKAQWGFNHTRCVVCNGWTGDSESDFFHNATCPVGIALGSELAKRSRVLAFRLFSKIVIKVSYRA